MGNERVLAQVESALRARHGDLELLSRPPVRDDLAFGDQPLPTERRTLDAWFYSAHDRTAYATLALGPGELARTTSWSHLQARHLHGHYAGDRRQSRRWTPVSIVAMPLLPPFDEPGLRIRPLLALDQTVELDGGSGFAETHVASVREGRSAVVPVTVFSAAHQAAGLVTLH